MKITIAIAVILLLLPAGSLLGQVPAPTITSISPTWALAGSGGFTLTVLGTNYVPSALAAGSTVRWNGLPLATTFVGSTELQVNIDAALLVSPGTVTIDVVNPSAQTSNQVQFLITTLLSIVTKDPLPSATVGSAYSVPLEATGGNPPYLNWRVVEGGVPGINLDSVTGILSGTATAAGSYTFQVSVDDSAVQTASTVFHLDVNFAPVTITSASPLPDATAGAAYSQQFLATGGTGEYISWVVSSGSLPTGLHLSTAGTLSGIPTESGLFTFTVLVADSAENTATKQFDLSVGAPEVPSISITGLTDTVEPADQPSFDVRLSAAYTLPITGSMTLAFTPDAVNPVDDPAIQFSTGGRTLNFTIAAGQTSAFPTAVPALQTGTVAGTITLTITSLSVVEQSILPSPPPGRSVQIPMSAPVITSVRVVQTANGFDVQITGYSTSRQMTQATFLFTAAPGGTLQTAQITVPVEGVFATWYASAASSQFGSAFLYTQPFAIQGYIADIASITVTLGNSEGTSLPASAAF